MLFLALRCADDTAVPSATFSYVPTELLLLAVTCRILCRGARITMAAETAKKLDTIELKSGKASATVYPFGATVASYKCPHEVLFVRPDAKMDGSKPISGGIPHCFPQFGPGKIQQHGFARNLVWKVVSKSDKAITLELTDNAEVRYSQNVSTLANLLNKAT